MREILSLLVLFVVAAQARADGGIFVGTTPCGAPVRAFLGIGSREKCDSVHWDLGLALRVNRTTGPNLVATVEYGEAGKSLRKLKREGLWTAAVGTPEHPGAAVYQLTRGKAKLALWKVTDETVHLLNAKRQLLVGNADRGYALSVALANQPPARPGPRRYLQYKPSQYASGPQVYGIFEGTTPCDLAQVIAIPVAAPCDAINWRLTLFQDAVTHVPTRYRLESGLFPIASREGAITMLPGTRFDATAKVVRLEPAEGTQPLYLMRGDENVLFFLDQAGKLGFGNRDYNYTLNRRSGN
ncbi:MAG: hypothetical protein ABI769_00605 [Pseudomonadota bacterium]